MILTVEQEQIREANAVAQAYRKAHGDEFEEKIDVKLTKHGIPAKRETIQTSDGKFISDHSYKHYWCESTTHMDKKRVDEFIKKKKLIQEVRPDITNFVLFYENDFKGKSQKDLRKRIESEGWKTFGGENEIDCYIRIMQYDNAFHKNKKIQVASTSSIPLDKLHKNPLNRRINEKAVFALAKSIVEYGFITGLFVVPMYDNYENKNIIGYMLYEGHHRLDAVIYVRDYYDYEIPDLPCIVVDWLSDKDHEKLANLLIKINKEYRKWDLKDYIHSHLEISKLLKDLKKQESYQILEDLRLESERNNLGKNALLYICGPLYGSSNFLDSSLIEDGLYRVSRDEYDNFMIPFVDKMVKPFHGWYKKQDTYSLAVYRYFMSSLYSKYKLQQINDRDLLFYDLVFQGLGTDTPIKIDQFNKQLWTKINDKVLALSS